MNRYRLKIGEPIDFTSYGPEGVLDAWRLIHKYPNNTHEGWRKTCASMACDWSGKPVRFDSDESFTADMIRHGMLEVIDAKQG